MVHRSRYPLASAGGRRDANGDSREQRFADLVGIKGKIDCVPRGDHECYWQTADPGSVSMPSVACNASRMSYCSEDVVRSLLRDERPRFRVYCLNCASRPHGPRIALASPCLPNTETIDPIGTVGSSPAGKQPDSGGIVRGIIMEVRREF